MRMPVPYTVTRYPRKPSGHSAASKITPNSDLNSTSSVSTLISDMILISVLIQTSLTNVIVVSLLTLEAILTKNAMYAIEGSSAVIRRGHNDWTVLFQTCLMARQASLGVRNGPPTNFNGRGSSSLWEYLKTEGGVSPFTTTSYPHPVRLRSGRNG